MRLINVGTLEMVGFVETDLPSYVILSHTWEDEEISFQEMNCRTSSTYLKKGYQKIVATCERAKLDGFGWVWIDTCCIDKSSSAELTEDINSMFRYYSEAECCYVYLADLGHGFSDADTRTFVSQSTTDIVTALKTCRWFSRGWTLQELLAPRTMKFFTQNWSAFGDKKNLCTALSTITGVHTAALEAPWIVSTERFSIAQRFSWAANRKTTRIEDKAYSLLGLFGVSMPLIYGEGKNAFVRLQEEIIRISDDQTIFAWSALNDFIPVIDTTLLAMDPECFKACAEIVPWKNEEIVSKYDYNMSNRGLYITIPIIPSKTKNEYYGVLGCKSENNLLGPIAMRLWHSESDPSRTYEPLTGLKPRLKTIIATEWEIEKYVTSVYIKRRSTNELTRLWYRNQTQKPAMVLVRSFESTGTRARLWHMTFENPEPKESWNKEGQTLKAVAQHEVMPGIHGFFLVRLTASYLPQAMHVAVTITLWNSSGWGSSEWYDGLINIRKVSIDEDTSNESNLPVIEQIRRQRDGLSVGNCTVAEIEIGDGLYLKATMSHGTLMDPLAFAIDFMLSTHDET